MGVKHEYFIYLSISGQISHNSYVHLKILMKIIRKNIEKKLSTKILEKKSDFFNVFFQYFWPFLDDRGKTSTEIQFRTDFPLISCGEKNIGKNIGKNIEILLLFL